ncbi:hypothetical protein ACFU9F_36260 [Streptomyces zhihengii]|uniref:hypothetical protein n=1 Tax=Streptomyces zhihengii TaxID=1818004 RepID=UPI00368C2894
MTDRTPAAASAAGKGGTAFGPRTAQPEPRHAARSDRCPHPTPSPTLPVDVNQLTYAGETLHGLLLTTRTRTRLVLARTLPPVLRDRIAISGTECFLPTAPSIATAIILVQAL